MDFVGTGSGGGSLGSENGPPIFIESNRTSAYDDLRSVFIYIFIVAIFFSFFLILPGIRNEKFPTFLCITTSLIVTSIILISLFGTSWHAGQAQISAPYKAFSKDRIQGELSIRVGLRSVNITLRAHKYYELQVAQKPVIIRKAPPPSPPPVTGATASQSQPTRSSISSSEQVAPSTSTSFQTRASKPLNQTRKVQAQQTGTNLPESTEPTITTTPTINHHNPTVTSPQNLAEELLVDRTADGASVDTELEVDDVFPPESSSSGEGSQEPGGGTLLANGEQPVPRSIRSTNDDHHPQKLRIEREDLDDGLPSNGFTVERLNVDINYNERFYWIEPNQMRQEHHNALERGLPYPILTVVEYLSQDEAGFSWSRQYRLAGYYTHILLWLSFCLSLLMFFLHCATPKYGIYTMQVLGCLLLFTNLTYSTLVPKGDQKLVIPFEGQQLTLKFGWNYWLVFVGGCLSLAVGTLIVIVDSLYPNYIFTTVLDVDFDTPNKYYKITGNGRSQWINKKNLPSPPDTPKDVLNSPTKRLIKPPFYVEPLDEENISKESKTLAIKSSQDSSTTKEKTVTTVKVNSQQVMDSAKRTRANELLSGPLVISPASASPSSSSYLSRQENLDTFSSEQSASRPTSDSEMVNRLRLVERNSSVVEMMMPGLEQLPAATESSTAVSDSKTTLSSSTPQTEQQQQQLRAPVGDAVYSRSGKTHRQQGKSVHLKSTDQQTASYLQSQPKLDTNVSANIRL